MLLAKRENPPVLMSSGRGISSLRYLIRATSLVALGFSLSGCLADSQDTVEGPPDSTENSATGISAPSGFSLVADREALASSIEDSHKHTSDMADCYRANGLIVDELSPGELSVRGASDFEHLHSIRRGCEEEVGSPPPLPYLSADLIGVIYADYLASRDCLLEAGYRPAEAPSLDVFIADYQFSYTRGSPPWSPWDEFGPAALSACPERPLEQLLRDEPQTGS